MTTNHGNNGSSFSHLIGQLDHRLQRIEVAIDRLADELDGKHEKLNFRIDDLEKTRSEQKGGVRTLVVIGGAVATVGGVVGNMLAKFWPN